MKALTASQLKALRALETPWVAAWWGGKPHGGWPEGINARSYDVLVSRRLIHWTSKGRFDRAVSLTAEGRAILSSNSKDAT